MKLFIIGNGFDLAHGLPTRYWDFRKYLNKYHFDFLQTFEEQYSIYPSHSDNVKSDILWNCFETNLANINEAALTEYATSMDMQLESGDIGIEDTLYHHFHQEFNYIKNLSRYLKRWVQGIKVKKAHPITSKINKKNFYINFNYTSTLEKIYNIDTSQIIYIHGSLHEYDDNPIIGHGNIKRLELIKKKIEKAENEFSEKEASIYKVINDYYKQTYKDVNTYMNKLFELKDKSIDEVNIIGHSVAGVDLPYFRCIDALTDKPIWNVFYFNPNEEQSMRNALKSQGIEDRRINTYNTNTFYDLKLGD